MMWPFNRTAKRLALAEIEMLKAIAILAIQQAQTERALNEVIEAVNRLGGIVGLEYYEADKKWMRPQ